ncbi:MAG TPA: CHRD domain-containing protein, partial [Aestuariivirgaceae bacterium]|nr:CHRD domain-containing protein [Aestuariivirgaceae bacterium]
MRNSRFFLAVFGFLGFVVQAPEVAHPQTTGHDGHGTTLYVAALEGQQVVSPVTTKASGTGAFILKVDGNRNSLGYDLTYQSLLKPPRRIALRNFGEGGVGRVVHVICGGDAPACAQQTGTTLKGEWTDRLSPALAREVAVGRIYLEIEDE